MHQLTIRGNDAGQRLDKFLRKCLPALPPSLLYKSIRTKKIKVNRRRAVGGQILREGDTVQLFLPDEFFPEAGSPGSPTDSALRLTPRVDILYEDSDILLAVKPAGMASQPDERTPGGTLIDHIKAYLAHTGEYRPSEEQSFAPALCNRIDRGTVGIVIAAKNAAALREMNALIRARAVRKFYLLVCHGHFEEYDRAGVLRHYLVKDSARNRVTLYDRRPEGEEARTCATRYRVLAQRSDPALSLVEAELLTGRTHQIRAQFARVGHPLLGEGKYTRDSRADRAMGYKTQALAAYRVSFPRKFPGESLPSSAPESCGERLTSAAPVFPKGCLPDVRGRVFTLPREKIYFLSELFSGVPLPQMPTPDEEEDETAHKAGNTFPEKAAPGDLHEGGTGKPPEGRGD